MVKVLGRAITYRILDQCMRDIWKLEWEHEMVDLDRGYFLVQF